MKCQKCKSEDTTVIDTRKVKHLSIVSRVRHCNSCDYIWSTKEIPDKEFNHKGIKPPPEEDNLNLFEEEKR